MAQISTGVGSIKEEQPPFRVEGERFYLRDIHLECPPKLPSALKLGPGTDYMIRSALL